MITVDRLSVRFGSALAVREASFEVAKGESFGLVGESGSGKSTILRALTGLVDIAGGTMILDGEALGRKRSRRFHRVVQMVFQDPYGSLHPRHTIDRILSEPCAIHGLDRPEQRVLGALDDVGLGPSFRFRYPHQLSGGQRQRVAIARAIIAEPQILLLDEPTSALDVSIQAEVLNLLARLRRQRGLTYILVSHNLAVVAHMCERLAVMNRGEIVEQLTAADLHRREAGTEYTRLLMRASEGYDPALASL
ncbi:MAG: ABC transporter ATP-binding protein [Ferrovibrionaceae bacterium]